MGMGRLFWKFFAFFWLAQLITTLGVGIAIWTLRPAYLDDRPLPPPQEWREAHTDRPPLRPPPHGPRWLPPLMPIVAGSFVSLLFAALLAWYFSRPILILREAFDAVANGQLDTRTGARMGTRRDELADLGADFDRMAERLKTLIDSQRRLLHDVSHELRSPLARLQAAADLMRQQPERSAEFIERLERDTAHMDRLVGELLTLARLDAGIAHPFELLDLAGLVGDVIADVRLEAETRPCHITLNATGEPRVMGNVDLLQRALENVLRNAIRHSPPHGEIHVSLQTQADQALLTIADAGTGVAADELESIFEPFQRARNADAFAGYGLGLAITRRVMHAHGGNATAANRPEGGLAVRLCLPLAP
ncbi:hypothetical protein MASR1M60_26240 [Rhodocyclaceae bacterium]